MNPAALPSPPDPRDHNAEIIFLSGDSKPPEQLDYRPWLNPVRDQGRTSTCAAQTAACMKEWQEHVDGGTLADLSEQFIYNFRANAPAEGMYGRDVMRILHKIGICTEREFPQGSREPCSDKEILERAAKNRIREYARVYTIQGLKLALKNSGPCYISFPMYNTNKHFWKPEHESEKPSGHAVAVVGYNLNGFILRNSWGKRWADDGYTDYPYEDFGVHYEIWTCVDRKGSPRLPPAPPPPPTTCGESLLACTRKLFSM